MVHKNWCGMGHLLILKFSSSNEPGRILIYSKFQTFHASLASLFLAHFVSREVLMFWFHIDQSFGLEERGMIEGRRANLASNPIIFSLFPLSSLVFFWLPSVDREVWMADLLHASMPETLIFSFQSGFKQLFFIYVGSQYPQNNLKFTSAWLLSSWGSCKFCSQRRLQVHVKLPLRNHNLMPKSLERVNSALVKVRVF